MNVRTFGRTAALGACMIALAAAGACGKKENENHNAATTNRAANTTTTSPSNMNTMSSTTSAEDANIKAKATQNLEKAGVTGVTVTVANGELMASGTVPAAKWTAAMQALNEAGAKKVDNSKLVKGS